MNQETNRRSFLRSLGLITVGATTGVSFLSSCGSKPSGENQQATADTTATTAAAPKELFFKISLAEWSLHKSLFDGKLTNLDFPAKAKNDFGISAVEYVNQFFKDKAKDQAYLADLKKRCDDLGVTSVLIMCDGEGELGDADAKKRKQEDMTEETKTIPLICYYFHVSHVFLFYMPFNYSFYKLP